MTDVRPDAKPLQSRKTLRPRDAATLIVVDGSSGEPRVLLGRRRPRYGVHAGALVCSRGAASIRETGTSRWRKTWSKAISRICWWR